ncbi:hypothetical protein HJFPF1_11303 [Paramyrothecium foliicola]|nr:hypothetical protein HJFPF1_11303 [Paramyrothecium foliicola]
MRRISNSGFLWLFQHPTSNDALDPDVKVSYGDSAAPRDKASRLRYVPPIHSPSLVGFQTSAVDLHAAPKLSQVSGARGILPRSFLVARSMPRLRRNKRSKSKPSRKVTEEEGWWSIRAIIDERVSNGCTEYLVDWEPDSATGKTFEATWSSEVTDEAKSEWESKKAFDATATAKSIVSPADSQESQPPRPSNWRHIKRAQPQDSSRKRPLGTESDDESEYDDNIRKRQRKEFSATLSDASVPSFTSAPSVASVADVEDLSAVEGNRPHPQVLVEISKVPAFDPSEFQTQSTLQSGSSQSIAELEDRDERLAVSSQLSQRTVPDSQEPSGQSWSQDRRRSQVLTLADTQSDTKREPTPIQNHSSPKTCVPGDSQDAAVSVDPDSEIPSHQPRDSGDQLSAQPDPQSLQGPQVASQEPSASRTSQATETAFLTQVDTPLDDQTGVDLFSSSVARIEATTSEDNSNDTTRQQDQPSQRDSQAAQIVRHDPSPHTEEFATSGDTHEDLASTSSPASASKSHEKEPPPSSAGFGSSFRAEDFSTYAERLSSQPRSERVSPEFRSRAMEGLGSDDPSASRRVSAVDELRQLCSFDDIITDSTPSNADSEQHLAESQPAGGDQVALSSAVDSIMPPPPSVNIHSQVLDPASSWVPESSVVPQELENEPLSHPMLTQPPMETSNETQTQTSSSLQGNLSSGTIHPGSLGVQLATVSPADITRLMVDDAAALDTDTGLAQSGISPSALDLSSNSVTMAQLPFRNDEENRSLSSTPSDDSPVDHLVTLPFHARARPLYDDTILEYRNEIKRFGDVFNSEIYMEPDSALLARIDELLSRLQSLCDLPQDFDGINLARLSPSEQVKYSYDGSTKFHFVFELLQALEKDTNVLIIAKSQDILRILFYMAESLKIECQSEALGRSANFESSAVRLTLALPTEELDVVTGFDIVIGFDPTYSQSSVAKQLSSLTERKSPHLLLLVTTHAIEHIDLRIPGGLPPSERRNALLSGIVRARKLVSDPERGCSEPNEIAKLFSDYFNGADEPLEWEPVPIPDHVLDIYETMQSQGPTPAVPSKDEEIGSKRKFDDDDGGDAKRMRILPLKETLVQVNEPLLSDEVRRFLEGISNSSAETTGTLDAKVLVSVSVLESLAEEHAGYRHKLNDTDYVNEYKSVISRLEKQVLEYERTINHIYAKHRSAIEDRSRFEKEKLKADATLKASTDSARVQGEKLQKKISELEATIARLGTASDDSGAQVNTSAQPLQEAREKIEALEKKLNSARSQSEFVTSQYQDARSEATQMRTEIKELRQQNLQLQQTSLENFAQIHRIQAEASGKQYLAQISDLRTMLRERELELDRTREELQQLKNGRRETRQVSMPRSPRMGMMSPRNGRGYGGSTSRGTSPAPGSGAETPVPGMQYLTQQTGNVRWNHLRE